MKKINIFLVFVILFSLFQTNGYGQCMFGWLYKVPVTVNNPGASTLTNYQVSITVNTQALITAGKMQATGNDLRFSDGSCTNLPYWIESGINTTSTVIWINDNSAPVGNSTIYMYYGNPVASAASDGNSTFILFDDFNGASLDASKWSFYSQSGSQTESGGSLNLVDTGGEATVISNVAIAGPYYSEIKVDSASGSWPNIAQIDSNTDYSNGNALFADQGDGIMYFGHTSHSCAAYDGYFDHNYSISGNLAGILSIARTSTNSIASWPGGSDNVSDITLPGTVSQNSAFGLLCSGGGNIAIDWFRARQYSATGSTQTLGAEVSNRCFPTAASWSNEGDKGYGADSFSIIGYGGSNLNNGGIDAAADPVTGFLDRTGVTPVNLQQGGVYASSVVWDTSSAYEILQVWIDFNDDGAFDTSEEVSPVSGWPVNQPTNFNITIPVHANPGNHLMRLRSVWEVTGSDLGFAPAHMDPCQFQFPGIGVQYYSGDVVEYMANIVCLPVTAGAIAGPMSVCPGNTAAPLIDTTGTVAGVWSSGNTAVATIDPTGIVTGVTSGTALISYSVRTSCGIASVTSTFTVDSLPVIDTVTGGGRYCANDSGLVVSLNSSDTGISYILYSGKSTIDTVAGTDTAINFGFHKVGYYTVWAINNTTGCTSEMASHARIRSIPIPHIHTVTGGIDSFCSGLSGDPIGLDGSYHKNVYKLYDGSTLVDSLYGTGSSLNFGPQSVGGTYTVIATDTATRCMTEMDSSAIMIVIPLVTPVVTIYPTDHDTLCDGALATFTASITHGGLTPFYQWRVNGATVDTDIDTYSYVPANGDVVVLAIISDANCLLTPLASTDVTLDVEPIFIPAVSIGGNPGAITNKGEWDTLKAVVTGGGPNPTYRWLKNGHPIAGATSSVYVSDSFANNDSVTCIVRGSGECGLPSFNSLVMQVSTTGIAGIASGTELTIVPNPNKGVFIIKGSLGTTSDEEVSLEISNMLGQSVYKNKVMTQGGAINEEVQLSNSIASGMYLLNVVSGTENKVFHIVIKQ